VLGSLVLLNASMQKKFKMIAGPFQTLEEANKSASKIFQSYAAAQDFSEEGESLKVHFINWS
jgi:hypothetical protein